MSELRKRDEADQNAERQRPGATLMMTCDSSTKLRSMRTPISHGVEIEDCASASNNVFKRLSRKGLCEANDETVQETAGPS